MAANILITGGSGYLGGSFLAHLRNLSSLPPHGTVYALVRSPEQASKVSAAYNATPLTLDLEDQDAITKTLVEKEISVIFYLIDVRRSEPQARLIKALRQVQDKTGRPAHFVQTSGAKLFSSHVNHPTDHEYADDDAGLYAMQKAAKPDLALFAAGVRTNSEVIEAAEASGIRGYTYIPCIVYGEGTGFGNKISIQTVAFVRAAKAVRQVVKVDKERYTWPVSHISDSVALYTQMLHKILAGEDIGHNKNGYYLASSGSVAWEDFYAAMAKALAKRGVVDDAKVHDYDEGKLQQIAKALDKDVAWLSVEYGGLCTLTSHRGETIGWTSKYPPEHILEAADEEVELILRNI